MQDAHSVITQAVNGFTQQLADEMEVSLRRMYEILGHDNPYPKAKRLIRKIARFNQKGARLIKVDLHREAADAVQAYLEDKPAAHCKKELRELISVASAMLENCETGTNGMKVVKG